ncbi:MAG: amidohydrolase [Mogibacterium sp.]|nr:amidohydrolase [Mogibacterium sp.]
MDKNKIYEIVGRLQPTLEAASRYIWENPELGGSEEKAAAYFRKLMQDAGFRLGETPDVEHGFTAEFGSGKPVIAILGEYDALPGLSQKPCAVKEPVSEGAPGHGCGHNLLGAGSAAAAIAVKEILEAEGLAGTVRFYGCPEEELLIRGKVKMVYHKLFDDVDFAITWHPMCQTLVWDGAALANVSARFYFTGISAHAGAAPEKGRSALDAVELMNVGVNYLREHVIDKARIHYTTNSGGLPPNIVPPNADSWYFIRAPHMSDIRAILERIKKIAQGAALMTETDVKIEVEGGCCEILRNHAFADLVQENLEACPRPDYTDEELKFARELQATVDPAIVARDEAIFGSVGEPMMKSAGERDLYLKAPLTASTDGGDVSFAVPMHMFASACWPIGVAPHTWQAAAANGTTLAEKGALYAAKVLAATACDLLTRQDVANAITREFEESKDPDYAPMVYLDYEK